jgi:hypothetical protein
VFRSSDGLVKSDAALMTMSNNMTSEDNLRQRLAYFEERLELAKSRRDAKETRPRSFDEGYTTERLKTWAESIALITERINGINFQLCEISSAVSLKDQLDIQV